MSSGEESGPSVAGMPSSSATVADLRRWVDFGGTWRVERRDATSVTLALCRCDGGEQVDVLVSADPELLKLVGQAEGDGESVLPA